MPFVFPSAWFLQQKKCLKLQQTTFVSDNFLTIIACHQMLSKSKFKWFDRNIEIPWNIDIFNEVEIIEIFGQRPNIIS